MFDFLKKGKRINECARETAREFFAAAPPELIDQADSSKAQKQYRKAIDTAAASLRRYKAALRLGVYGKAKFHLVFMEQLSDLGYGPEAVKAINRQLLVKVP